MLVLSFFGVTPGFERRDFAEDKNAVDSLMHVCSDMVILDQFRIRIPCFGELYVIGGRKVGSVYVNVLGLFRYAKELGGNRSGGYYGAAIWLIDQEISSAILLQAVTHMTDRLQQQALDKNMEFVHRFDDLDWSFVGDILNNLNKHRRDYNRKGYIATRGTKIVFIGSGHRGEKADSLDECIKEVQQQVSLYENRIVYVTEDRATFDEIGKLGVVPSATLGELRVEFEDSIKNRDFELASWVPESRDVFPNKDQNNEMLPLSSERGSILKISDELPRTSRTIVRHRVAQTGGISRENGHGARSSDEEETSQAASWILLIVIILVVSTLFAIIISFVFDGRDSKILDIFGFNHKVTVDADRSKGEAQTKSSPESISLSPSADNVVREQRRSGASESDNGKMKEIAADANATLNCIVDVMQQHDGNGKHYTLSDNDQSRDIEALIKRLSPASVGSIKINREEADLIISVILSQSNITKCIDSMKK